MAKKTAPRGREAGLSQRQGTGIVVRNTGSRMVVRPDEEGPEVPCVVKGNLRIKGIRTTNPVAVGDHVRFLYPQAPTPGEEGAAVEPTGMITEILPRRNYIIRKATNLSKESHILASNLDLAVLIATLKEPVTTTNFIDRFLATAEAYAIPAALVLNKMDTWDEEDRELADAIAYLYRSIGYPVLFVSARTGEGIPELLALVQHKTTLMAGNSGVGKSSVINALVPGADLRTGAISEIHHTGQHTTTFSEMIDVPGGGYLIDIPGVRGFGTIDMAPAEVSHYFPEIFKVSEHCRYGGCTHTHEPGCAVLQALDEGRIAQSRYASYLSILEDASTPEKYRKPY